MPAFDVRLAVLSSYGQHWNSGTGLRRIDFGWTPTLGFVDIVEASAVMSFNCGGNMMSSLGGLVMAEPLFKSGGLSRSSAILRVI